MPYEFLAVVILVMAAATAVSIAIEKVRKHTLEQRLQARWRVLVEGKENVTTVYVFRDAGGMILDRMVVAVISNGDTDYRRKLNDAEAEAEERVAQLERGTAR